MVAAALFVGSCAVLLATSDMGFTRDESFYFDFGESYQGWFHDVGVADEPAEALGRKATVRTWQGNFEHPPLMKALFGWSWALLARKDRAVGRVMEEEGKPAVTVRGLKPADGFDVGAEATLLGPLVVGQDVMDPSRVLGAGVVTRRSDRQATVELRADADLDALKTTCGVRPGAELSPRPMTGCQVREDRFLAVMSETTAMRFVAIVFSGLAVMLTFLLGVALFGGALGPFAGLFAALAFLFTPRHFFHAHLICFDMPIVTATLATLYAFWRARSDRRWALATAVLWGVALLIKHNAFFLPVPLLVFWMLTGRHELSLRRDGWRWRLRLPSLPLALLVMPLVALPMLFVFWPRLWYDPFHAVANYFSFHVGHVHYMQWYFGQPLQVPPFPVAFPFVLTATTVPVVFQVLTLVGCAFALPLRRAKAWWRSVRSRTAPTDHERAIVFVLLNGVIPILLIALPSVPIFGGIKHWMTGMPFLWLLAGYGLARALRPWLAPVRRLSLRVATAAVLLGALLAGPAIESVRATAFGTGYYDGLAAGGIQGAADRQMMRLYWGHTTRQALDWLNRRAPQGAKVFFQNTTHTAYRMYQRDGLLREDVRLVHHVGASDIALIEPQKAFAELDIEVRQALGVAGPSYVVRFDGVPMLRVYVRPSTKLSGLGLGDSGRDRTDDVGLQHQLSVPVIARSDLEPHSVVSGLRQWDDQPPLDVLVRSQREAGCRPVVHDDGEGELCPLVLPHGALVEPGPDDERGSVRDSGPADREQLITSARVRVHPRDVAMGYIAALDPHVEPRLRATAMLAPHLLAAPAATVDLKGAE